MIHVVIIVQMSYNCWRFGDVLIHAAYTLKYDSSTCKSPPQKRHIINNGYQVLVHVTIRRVPAKDSG